MKKGSCVQMVEKMINHCFCLILYIFFDTVILLQPFLLNLQQWRFDNGSLNYYCHIHAKPSHCSWSMCQVTVSLIVLRYGYTPPCLYFHICWLSALCREIWAQWIAITNKCGINSHCCLNVTAVNYHSSHWVYTIQSALVMCWFYFHFHIEWEYHRHWVWSNLS